MRNEYRQAYQQCAQQIVAGHRTLADAERLGYNLDAPVFAVGKTAEMVNIHPQTLRQYDRLGLIVPQRTEGGARRYSLRDIYLILQTQYMSQVEAINIAGIARILHLMEENRQLKRQVKRLRTPQRSSVFAAHSDGEVIEFIQAVNIDDPGTLTQSTYDVDTPDLWRRQLYQCLEITAR